MNGLAVGTPKPMLPSPGPGSWRATGPGLVGVIAPCTHPPTLARGRCRAHMRTMPMTWYNKGAALSIQGKYDEAIKAYDEAIRLDPNFAMSWNNKGLALIDQGKLNESVEANDEAIKLDPNLVAMPGSIKAMLSIHRASTMRQSRHTMRPSDLIPPMSMPGTTKAPALDWHRASMMRQSRHTMRP